MTIHIPDWLSRSSMVLSRLRENIHGEFDPGSGRTLAACLTHASRTMKPFGVD